MRVALALTVIVAALVLLVTFGRQETLLGLRPDQLASLAVLTAFGIVVLGWVISHFRGEWQRALEALAFWMAILVALVALYSYRFEIADVANRLLGEIAPGHVINVRGGEVAVVRSASGSFVLEGRVNGALMPLIFDTGASTVVLTSEAAAKAGIKPRPRDFSVPIMTANGRAAAAPAVIETLAIGSIVAHKVEALVARPGSLPGNLLGMSFLERLTSYEVRGNRLILRSRGS